MSAIRVSPLVIVKRKFLSVSPARKLRSVPGFPPISSREMYHARPAEPYHGFLHHPIGKFLNAMYVHTLTDFGMLLSASIVISAMQE
jgi:hypothetical protein